MYQIEKCKFDEFCRIYESTNPQHLRFGQAFHQYFRLDKMSDTVLMDRIYAADDSNAKHLIYCSFTFI